MLYHYLSLEKRLINKKRKITKKLRINGAIRARNVRVIDENGDNLGVLATSDALKKAEHAGLDLVEISEKSDPPITRIVDHGKYQYEQNKLKKKNFGKEKSKVGETKSTQIKPGTGEDMKLVRAKKIREWLDEGYKVHIDLFLSGRYKSMEESFLKGKLSSFMESIPGEFLIIQEISKSPKGFSTTIQKKK